MCICTKVLLLVKELLLLAVSVQRSNEIRGMPFIAIAGMLFQSAWLTDGTLPRNRARIEPRLHALRPNRSPPSPQTDYLSAPFPVFAHTLPFYCAHKAPPDQSAALSQAILGKHWTARTITTTSTSVQIKSYHRHVIDMKILGTTCWFPDLEVSFTELKSLFPGYNHLIAEVKLLVSRLPLKCNLLLHINQNVAKL